MMDRRTALGVYPEKYTSRWAEELMRLRIENHPALPYPDPGFCCDFIVCCNECCSKRLVVFPGGVYAEVASGTMVNGVTIA